MSSLPFVSIIVLNFNGKRFLKECLQSLERLRYSQACYEIIMGDNASTDGSVEFVQEYFPRVKIVRADKNYGFCKTNNLCAKTAKGEYLAFVNNDAFVTPDWLTRLVEGVISEPKIISCASKILFPHLGQANVINSAGGVVFPCGGGLYEGLMDEDSPRRYGIRKKTGFGAGAGMLIQKEFFLETGGWDEYYFYGCEEMDLGFRVWMQGYEVLYVPEALMYHYMGKTGFRDKGVTPTIEFLNIRNGLYYILKNFQLWTLIKGLFLYVIRNLFKVAYALRYGNIRILEAILKAHWVVLKDLPKVLAVRKQTQKARTVSDRELYRKGIIATYQEVYRRLSEGAQRMRKYQTGSFYDTKDAVKIRVEENGEFTFYQT